MSISSHQQGNHFVTRNSIYNLSKLVKRIQGLFNVQVTIPETGNNEGEWISLSGVYEDIHRAKEYIQAVSQPECTKVVSLDPAHKDLFCNVGNLTDQIQVRFAVYVGIREKTMEICGKESSVVKAVSQIQEITGGQEGGFVQDSLLNGNDLLPKIQSLSLNNSSEGDRVFPPQSDHQRIVEELIRLGYSQESVTSAIQSAGSRASYNEVLSRLTRSPVVARTTIETVSLESPSPQYPVAPPLTPAKAIRPANGLRPIVIDGSNVAISHGPKRSSNPVFSCKGILIVVNYFKSRGHDHIYVFVPLWRKEQPGPANNIVDQHILRDLDQEGLIKYTPSRTVNSRRVASYDDLYIVNLAHDIEGIIVSNDNYRDVAERYPQWKETIDRRLLMFTFVDDIFMPPEDPMGRHGPHLNDFLKVSGSASHQQECPHGKKCTFGRHCKYSHSDRDQSQKKVCPRGGNCTFGDACKFYHPERESPHPDRGSTPSELEKRGSTDSLVGKDASMSPTLVPFPHVPTHVPTAGYPPHQMNNSYSSHPDLHLPLNASVVPRTAVQSDRCYERSPQHPQFVPRSLSSPYLEHLPPQRVVYNNQGVYPHSVNYTYPQCVTPTCGQYPSTTVAGGIPRKHQLGSYPFKAVAEEREKLFDMLKAILPGKDDLIRQILHEYPQEKELSRLVRLCQDRCSPS